MTVATTPRTTTAVATARGRTSLTLAAVVLPGGTTAPDLAPAPALALALAPEHRRRDGRPVLDSPLPGTGSGYSRGF
jgi:hypothetical protein